MNLTYNEKNLETICTKYNADYLGVFGSVLHGDDTVDSDIDLLVKFSPNSKTGLFELSAMRDDLEQEMSRKVDLLTEGFLSKYFRDAVVSEAKPLYVKA